MLCPTFSVRSYLNNILDHLERLITIYELPIIVLGDFNCPDICWHTLASHSSRSSALCDFIFDNNMSQLITYPTHHNGHILDLLFTNDPDSVGDIVTIDNCPLVSDHIPLLAELKTSASQTSHI